MVRKRAGYKLKAKGLFADPASVNLSRIKQTSLICGSFDQRIPAEALSRKSRLQIWLTVNLSPVYCGALFKKQTGLSIKLISIRFGSKRLATS